MSAVGSCNSSVSNGRKRSRLLSVTFELPLGLSPLVLLITGQEAMKSVVLCELKS